MYQLKGNAEPINSMSGWNKLGRKIKNGEKSIELLMPITANINANKIKKKIKTDTEEEQNNTREEEREIEAKEEKHFKKTYFVFKKNWFGYSQTELINKQTEEEKKQEQQYLNKFNKSNKIIDTEKLLKNANIEKVKYGIINGNCQGYAVENRIAINPLAENLLKTLLHEVAHIVLGHTKDNIKTNSFDIHFKQEVEAEDTAYLLSTIFGANEDSLSKSRGYIQSYFNNIKYEEKTEIYKNIIKATDTILNYLN